MSGERTQQEALADRTGASSRGRVGWPDGGRLLAAAVRHGSGRARNRCSGHDRTGASQGQRCGRCLVLRRALSERVIKSGQPRRTAAGGSWWSPPARPDRCALVQRARLWAIHLYRQPGGVGGEAARGEMVQPPHTCLRSPDGDYSISSVAAMVGLQFEHLPVPVGDEAVIAVRRRRLVPAGNRAWASHAGRLSTAPFCGVTVGFHSGRECRTGLRPHRRTPGPSM